MFNDILIHSFSPAGGHREYTNVSGHQIRVFILALINLQELLKLPVPRNVQYVFRKTDQNGFRDVLRDIKGRGIYSIVVDTKPDNLPHLLKAVNYQSLSSLSYLC
ncbi:hypothetical protein AVEN_20076-1 [Araneus ventricosus]|uniref:Uncharacterized protein n=1 Tax=Araneus ventricosus TaxID=182803 RepID=A0A4Y2AZA4_ARAVE|nr:hypothetical protein AVEN_10415-1 [Araneus ventricosus]GBL85200.1 hypothetical protein AVEN_20076-1 [Araneus ventricosus]